MEFKFKSKKFNKFIIFDIIEDEFRLDKFVNRRLESRMFIVFIFRGKLDVKGLVFKGLREYRGLSKFNKRFFVIFIKLILLFYI